MLKNSGIFNSEITYEDSSLVIELVPWSASGRQLSAYGPASVRDKSKKMLLEDTRELAQHIFSLDDTRIHSLNSSACLATKTSTKTEIYENKVVELVYEKSKKLLKDGKFIGILGGAKSSSLGGLKAAAEKYTNIGLLSIDNIPYGGVEAFPNITKLKRIVAISTNYCSKERLSRAKTHESVETVTIEHLEWMKASNPWTTIAYDVVAALPPCVWVSIDNSCGLKQEGIDQILLSLNNLRRKIIGFDLYGINIGESLDATQMLYSLCNSILINQNRLPSNYCS
jgi:hypothetical protein